MPRISDDRRLLQELYLPPTDHFVLLDVPEMRFLMVDGNGSHDSDAFTRGTDGSSPLSDRSSRRPRADGEPLCRTAARGPLVGRRHERLHRGEERQIQVAADDRHGRLGRRRAHRSRDGQRFPTTRRPAEFAEAGSVRRRNVRPDHARRPEDDAVSTMDRLYNEFMPVHQLVATGSFHEIYLSDPKRVAPERMRTVLRQPVAHLEDVGTP